MPRFTRKELYVLEKLYEQHSYTTPEQNAKIGEDFGRSPSSIATWFRARRRKSIKSNHKPMSLTKKLEMNDLHNLQRQLHIGHKKTSNVNHQSASLVFDTDGKR